MLTLAKLSVGYLVVGITRELDKELLLHCSSIYTNTMWSMLQQCVYLMFYYSSTMLLPQGHHAMSMCPDIILFNMHAPCVHHEELMSLDIISNPNSFQTLLDPSRPLVLLDHSRLCHMTSRSHALFPLQTNNNTTVLFLSTNPNPKVCPHTCFITKEGYRTF